MNKQILSVVVAALIGASTVQGGTCAEAHSVWSSFADAEEQLNNVMSMLGLPSSAVQRGPEQIDEDEYAGRCAEEKVKVISASADEYVKKGGDAAKLQRIMHEFELLSKPSGNLSEAERKVDELSDLVGVKVDKEAEGISDPDAIIHRIQEKMQKASQAAPEWLKHGGNQGRLEELSHEVESALWNGGEPSAVVRLSKLDEALALIGKAAPLPDRSTLPKHPFMAVAPKRIQAKMHAIQQAAPTWVHSGGDQKKLETEMHEFERRMKQAQTEMEKAPEADIKWNKTRTSLDKKQSCSAIPSIQELHAQIQKLRVADHYWHNITWRKSLIAGLTESRRTHKPVLVWAFIDYPDKERC